MPKLLILADDLTGANDAGVQFAKRGIPAFVALSETADFQALFRKFEVVVLDSESRHVAPGEARRRVAAAVTAAQKAGAEYFYKKTDSTLRGNIGAELEALLAAAGRAGIAFVPALPDLGRTTRDGCQYVRGQLLHETSFARDPRNPMRQSEVAKVLGSQTNLPMSVVRAGERAALERLPNGVAIFDAESASDFREITLLLRRLGAFRVLAGTAGFAECLTELLAFKKIAPVPPAFAPPLLVINGSLNSVSLAQMAYAAARGFETLLVPPGLLLGEPGGSIPEEEILLREAVQILGQGKNLLLQSIRSPGEIAVYETEARRLSLSGALVHERAAANLGAFAARLLSLLSPRQLVVFGGDTLIGIARAARWAGFCPRAEIFPGVTVAEAEGSGGLLVISKAGGFGPESIVEDLRLALMGGRNASAETG